MSTAQKSPKRVIVGQIAGISGSPKGFIFVLQGPTGVVQLEMDIVAVRDFSKKYDVSENEPKELLRAISKKIMGKTVEISFS